MPMYMKQAQEDLMQSRITPTDTLGSVEPGEKRYDEACAEHARNVLRRWVKKFQNQETAAAVLGVNQGTLSRNMKESSQPQLKILIPLSKELGWTLDQVLGLSPPPAQPPPPPTIRISDSEVNRVAEKLADKLARRLTPPQGTPRQLPPSKKEQKKDR